MSLPVVPGVIAVRYGWSIGGDPLAQTTLHYHYTGSAPTAADCLNAADQISAFSWTSIAAIMHPDVSLTSVTVTDLSSMAEASGEAPMAVVGTRTGTPLPAGACVVASFRVNRRYRGGKPRNYLPWLTSTDLESTLLWKTTSQTAAESAVSDYVAKAFAQSAITIDQQVNVHRFSGYTLGPAAPGGFRKKIPTPVDPPHVDNIVSSTVPLFVGSQRRRNRDA